MTSLRWRILMGWRMASDPDRATIEKEVMTQIGRRTGLGGRRQYSMGRARYQQHHRGTLHENRGVSRIRSRVRRMRQRRSSHYGGRHLGTSHLSGGHCHLRHRISMLVSLLQPLMLPDRVIRTPCIPRAQSRARQAQRQTLPHDPHGNRQHGMRLDHNILTHYIRRE